MKDDCYTCYKYLRYGCKCENMGEKQPCWKPDYEVLWKAFKLAVMGVLTFSKFIYGDDELTKTMDRYLEKAKERAT